MDELFDYADPLPSSLIESLRSVGYSLSTAIADVIDNSITAKAQNLWINFHWAGKDSYITILDDGKGMTELSLVEAMRPGTQNPQNIRAPDDLGRFGLGLKTASFSQCRQLTVWTKTAGMDKVGRRWDLDYVARENAWKLLKGFNPGNLDALDKLIKLDSGTLVVWEKLDRLVDDNPVQDEEAHIRFIGLIKDVQDYLGMIFHRYLSGQAATITRPLNIFINGREQDHLVPAWDPFNISSRAVSEASPVEVIHFAGHPVTVQGFVLPHKDRLTDEEYYLGSGPRGWIAQQGYYIYRNDRILLAGDWLRLGRGRLWAKEEHYKLARLYVEIPNALDMYWSLDVKKSTAKPPAGLKGRLTDLGERVRNNARKVFTHRGHYGPRPSGPTAIIERPWKSSERSGHIVYQINRHHPLIDGVMKRLGPLAQEVDSMLRLIEETVPVQKIWLDTAESDKGHSIPYEGIDEKVIAEDMKKTYSFLKEKLGNSTDALAFLLATEPFSRYQHLADKITGDI